jgi:hypothetical protein
MSFIKEIWNNLTQMFVKIDDVPSAKPGHAWWVKVNWGNMSCRFRSITFLSTKEFWKYLAQMFAIMRQHVLTWSFIGYILCAFHNFLIVQRILKLLGTNVHNYGTMCHMQQPGSSFQCQGHTWVSKLNMNYSLYFVRDI